MKKALGFRSFFQEFNSHFFKKIIVPTNLCVSITLRALCETKNRMQVFCQLEIASNFKPEKRLKLNLFRAKLAKGFYKTNKLTNWKILPTIKPLNIKPAKRFNLNFFHAKLEKEQRRKGIETQRKGHEVFYKKKMLINGKYFRPLNIKQAKRFNLNLFHAKLAKEQRR